LASRADASGWMFSTSSALVVIRRAHSPRSGRWGRLSPVAPFF
jgi:hypothetical protein